MISCCNRILLARRLAPLVQPCCSSSATLRSYAILLSLSHSSPKFSPSIALGRAHFSSSSASSTTANGGTPPAGDDRTNERPQAFHLDHIKQRLEFTVPLMFKMRPDYTFYRKDVVLDNQILQVKRIGIDEISKHFGWIALLGNFVCMQIAAEPLNISPILEDGTVRLRWRIQYLHWYQLFNRRRKARWYDGYSIFYVDGEGLVYKFTIQKTVPDDSMTRRIENRTTEFAKRVGVLPNNTAHSATATTDLFAKLAQKLKTGKGKEEEEEENEGGGGGERKRRAMMGRG